MRGLGSALALALPEGETPLDWVIAQSSRLPLSVWEADDVAQMQMAVAIYAVVARYEAGDGVEPEMVRNLTERVWEHSHFVGQQEELRLEEPEVDELAARVLVELGNPSQEHGNRASRSMEHGGCLRRKIRLPSPSRRTE